MYNYTHFTRHYSYDAFAALWYNAFILKNWYCNTKGASNLGRKTFKNKTNAKKLPGKTDRRKKQQPVENKAPVFSSVYYCRSSVFAAVP